MSDESALRVQRVDDMECDQGECENTPVWVADVEIPTFLCDDHKDVYPSEDVRRIEEVADE